MAKNKYEININFNGYTCWFKDFKKFIKEFDFTTFREEDILLYSNYSNKAEYNLKIFFIDHDTKRVELIATLED